jgi:hypothetical protein
MDMKIEGLRPSDSSLDSAPGSDIFKPHFLDLF